MMHVNKIKNIQTTIKHINQTNNISQIHGVAVIILLN